MWYQLRRFFPDDCNGSRIICTSRDAMVLWRKPNPYTPIHFHLKMSLSNNNSWKLLCDVMSDVEDFNYPHLEEIGKEIVKKCEGLPLAVITMGKLLCRIERSVERWKEVLEDDDPFQIKRNDGQPISKSLYLSYDLLPHHLKFCFLYMGVFPEKYDIKPSQLILLLIVEGIVKPRHKSLEDAAAMEYLNELNEKSMVQFVTIDSNRQKPIDTFKVHFVFRCLCIREAQDERFIYTIRRYVDTIPRNTNLQQRLCIHNNTLLGFKEVHHSMESMSCVSSILYCGPQHKYPLRPFLNFTSLKILHALSIRFYEFPIEVLKLFRLRYLAITYDGELPRSIDKLWKLEFLILGRYHIIKPSHGSSYLPMEIWNLRWLKHLQCTGLDLQDPDYTSVILEYLSTLSGVSARSCTPKILGRMRNLKKLAVRIDLLEDEVESFSFFRNVVQSLHCLDSFKCVIHQVFTSHVFPPIPIFTTTISELHLSGCGFPWTYMSCISVLPNLKTLILKNYAFCGPVWEVSEGGFPRLEYLLLKDLNIEKWSVKPHQFPTLCKLVIQHCYNLQEIPIEFGDLPNLLQIHLYSNDISVEISARQILYMKQFSGHDMFEVNISKLGSPTIYMVSVLDTTLTSTTFEANEK